MKIISVFICLLALLGPVSAGAQRITMDEGHVSFDYPDEMLVVSPQLCGVYAPLLEDAGIDPEVLAEEMRAQGVLTRAYARDFHSSLSVIVREDDLSREIFDIASVTDSQRGTLRRRVEGDRLWEKTGLRAQDSEWQKENGEYWLYVHYSVTSADKMMGRGLRYITVKNGMYIMLDWQRDGKQRFTGRDLNTFRSRLSAFTLTEQLDRPVQTVKLDTQIPEETTTDVVTITGTATPGASVTAEQVNAFGEKKLMMETIASNSGRFSLEAKLQEEGVTEIMLTASKEGMNDAVVNGSIAYSTKTLPVSGVEESMVVSTDVTVLSGSTLAGVQIQLVTPFGLAKKRSGNDGSFSFDLTTEEEGTYSYTLILDKKGYNQRRVPFTITREMTNDQEKERIRQTAVKLSYKTLQKDLEENRGAVMRLYGPVSEVSGSGSTQYIRMKYSKDQNGWTNDVVIVASHDLGVKEGDMLTAVVKVDGVYSEQNASGAETLVPRFELLFVDRVE